MLFGSIARFNICSPAVLCVKRVPRLAVAVCVTVTVRGARITAESRVFTPWSEWGRSKIFELQNKVVYAQLSRTLLEKVFNVLDWVRPEAPDCSVNNLLSVSESQAKHPRLYP